MLKDGDLVTAKTLTEPGQRPKTIKGVLQIVEAEGDDIYPPFKAYFVNGQEADEGTIKLENDVKLSIKPLMESITTISPSSLAIYDFHAEHDQESHGNWATGADVTHGGMEDWQPKRKEAVLKTMERLQNRWGVRANLDARPSVKGKHQNYAEETGAIAAVAPWDPDTIHINPKMNNDQWIKQQLSRKTFIAKSVGDVITHEYGHVLEAELEQRKDFKTLAELSEPFTKVIGDADLGDKFGKADRNRLRIEVSYYAGQDSHEAIAESFLAYTKGQSNSWIDHVGSIYERVFRKGGEPK